MQMYYHCDRIPCFKDKLIPNHTVTKLGSVVNTFMKAILKMGSARKRFCKKVKSLKTYQIHFQNFNFFFGFIMNICLGYGLVSFYLDNRTTLSLATILVIFWNFKIFSTVLVHQK